MTTVSLKHGFHTLPNRVEPFYDGIAVAVDGVLTLDADELEHLRAAFHRGYNFTADGRRLYGFTQLEEYIESAKSAGVEGREPRKKSPNRRG